MTRRPASPAPLGDQITYTATVAGIGESPTNQGTVSFTDGGTAIPGCTAVVLSAGKATCSAAATDTSGTHPIAASYSGGAGFLASTGTLDMQVVQDIATTTTLSDDAASPTHLGQPVTYTATVTAGGPRPSTQGTVAFTDGGITIDGCAARDAADEGPRRAARRAPGSTSSSPGTRALRLSWPPATR